MKIIGKNTFYVRGFEDATILVIIWFVLSKVVKRTYQVYGVPLNNQWAINELFVITSEVSFANLYKLLKIIGKKPF